MEKLRCSPDNCILSMKANKALVHRYTSISIQFNLHLINLVLNWSLSLYNVYFPVQSYWSVLPLKPFHWLCWLVSCFISTRLCWKRWNVQTVNGCIVTTSLLNNLQHMYIHEQDRTAYLRVAYTILSHKCKNRSNDLHIMYMNACYYWLKINTIIYI